MKSVLHQWRGHVTAITKKSVYAAMRPIDKASSEGLMQFRRNKFTRADRARLAPGSFLTFRVVRNGNGKLAASVAVSNKIWTQAEINAAKLQAQGYAELFS